MRLLKILAFSLCFVSFSASYASDGFTKNIGQIITVEGHSANEVLFFYRGKSYDVYLQKDKISYVLKNGAKDELKILRTDLIFNSINPDVEIYSVNSSQKRTSYLNKKTNNIKSVECAEIVVYREIYSGIDLRFYMNDGFVKYDFIVHSNGDYHDIQMHYDGALDIAVDSDELIVQTDLGNLIETIPEIYQPKSKSKIRGSYSVNSNNISFQIGEYDKSKDLIIDPWSTFIGGVDIEESYSNSIDKSGNTYVSGYTGSANFPTTVGVVQTVKQGQYDAFLTKLDTTGKVIWSTFYGGVGDEHGYKTLTDNDDNVYLVGHTNGNDILVSSSGVFQSSTGGSYDAYIVKLDSTGNFIWGSYFGGSGGDFALTAGIDQSQNVIIGGYTSSSDLPLQNAFQNIFGGALDAYVAKFDSTGNLLWSTYCGGTNSEDVHAMHIDNQSNVIISGETFSSNFPTSLGAYQTINAGGKDVFLTKYDSLGNRTFSTYFGGFNGEDANALSSDNSGNIFMAGYTESLDFPIIGSSVFQPAKDGGKDGFVARFTAQGIPVKTTFIGGSIDDRFTCIDLFNNSSVFVGGYTSSPDLPLLGMSYQNLLGGLSDGMYYKLDTALTPSYSTFIGGASADYLNALTVGSNSLLTFSGYTSSSNFPVTSNVFQDTIAGQFDAFVFQTDSVFNFVTSLSGNQFSDDQIDIFPNPFFNELNITISRVNPEKKYQFKLYDLMGREEFNIPLNDGNTQVKSLSINQLKPTIYLGVIYENQTSIKTVRLIKTE